MSEKKLLVPKEEWLVWTNADLLKRAENVWELPKEAVQKLEGQWKGTSINLSEDRLEKWLKKLINGAVDLDLYWGNISTDMENNLVGHKMFKGQQAPPANGEVVTSVLQTFTAMMEENIRKVVEDNHAKLEGKLEGNRKMVEDNHAKLEGKLEGNRKMVEDNHAKLEAKLQMTGLWNARKLETQSATKQYKVLVPAELRFSEIKGSPAFGAVQLAEGRHNEAELCAELIRKLSPLVAPYSVVNSEVYKWDCCDDRKPDFSVGNKAYYELKDPYHDCADDTLMYGVPVSSLAECIVIGEVKLQRSMNQAKGELLQYLRLVCADCRGRRAGRGENIRNYRCVVRGIAMTESSFLMLEVVNDVVTSAEIGSLDDGGSEAAISQFIKSGVERDKFTPALHTLCKKLKVEPYHDGTKKLSFLGAGAYGRVFRVRSCDDKEKVYALKVAVDADAKTRLVSECEILTACMQNEQKIKLRNDQTDEENKNDNDGVVASCVIHLAGDICVVKNDCAGYLMEIGVPVERNKESLAGAFDALNQLHTLGIRHGDCRVANVVRVGEEYRWLDFAMTSVPHTDTHEPAAVSDRRKDWKCFIRSFYGIPQGGPVPPDVSTAIDELEATDESTNALKRTMLAGFRDN